MPSIQYKHPRREPRYSVRVPVCLRVGREIQKLYSGDVSFRGIYVCTDTPPTLRQLISVEVSLPPDNQPFLSHGMSVYVLQPKQIEDRMPGVGIQFYAQADSQRRKWERFVTHIKDHPPELPEDAVDPVHRQHPRVAARFEVHPIDFAELTTIYTRDVSSGGMFLETDVQIPKETALSLTIYHPITRAGFTIDAKVKRTNEHGPQGLGIEFLGMDAPRLGAFQDFMDKGLNALKVKQARADSIIVELDL